MSAHFSKMDKGWLGCYSPVKPITPYDEAIVSTTFDNETNEDITRIEKTIKRDVLLRKICLVKILLFPLEYFLIRLLLDKKKATDKLDLYRLYKKFYKKKISYEDFEKDLRELSISGKLV